MPRRTAILSVPKALAGLLAACCLAAAAHAVEAPDNVETEVAKAVQSCKDSDGTPNADAVLSAKDVNADGGEDWIADYSKLGCQGGINDMCDDDGCELQIYLWNGAAAWNLAFDEAVKSYKFARQRGHPVLQVVMPGSACNRPDDQTCHVTYRLNKDSVDPMQ